MVRWHRLLLLSVLVLCACGDSPADKRKDGTGAGAGAGTSGGKLGDSCAGYSCGEGLFCLTQSSFCTRECSGDEQCGDQTKCQEWSNGMDVCAPPCTDDRSVPNRFLCIDGRQTRCESVPDHNNCNKCGCPDGLLCMADGCKPPAQTGERCASDFDCASGNCSPYEGVCRVAIGSTCDANTCDRCMTFGDWSYCSRRCDSDRDCDGRGVCIGNDQSGFYCVVSCGWEANARTCPERCSQLPATATSTGMYYCGCKTCTFLEQKRKFGVPCEENFDCESNLCPARSERCGTSALVSCFYHGLCSSRCTTSAECGAGAFCSDGLCFKGCSSDGDCRDSKCLLLSTDVGPMSACDGRGGSGSTCRGDLDCRASRCVSRVCRGSAAIGQACTVDGDCQMGRCCAGLCSAACAQP